MICSLSQVHIDDYDAKEHELQSIWKSSLAGQGVKWPTSKVQRAQLVGLFNFVGQPVNKDSLGRFVNLIAGGALDTQARHLRPLGWYVIGSGRGNPEENLMPDGKRIPKGTYSLLSVVSASPEFLRSDRLKRLGRAGVRDWADLCQLYKYKCAHCGAECRSPDRGHMDPSRPATIDNLIPLCVDCNNWASDDVVFSQDGRIKAVLSTRFLTQVPQDRLKVIEKWIKDKLSE